MYASYSYLVGGSDHCKATSSTAYTDSTRFSCQNLATVPMVRSSIQSPISTNGQSQCVQGGCQPDTPGCTYPCEIAYPTTMVADDHPSSSIVVENYCPLGKTPIASITPMTATPVPTLVPKLYPRSQLPYSEMDTLLPVMDPRFNLREICKQCILLEDHLTHPEKRCTDCCIKHFLTIEALAEEAVTLDKEQKYARLIELAVIIRSLQDMWYKNPEDSAHTVSQKLREIRKTYQIDNFDIIFRDDKQQCSGGVCSVKKKKKTTTK